jgi:hypothetical protein
MARELMCKDCIHEEVCNMWLSKMKIDESWKTASHVLKYLIASDNCKHRIENSELNKVDYR